MNKQEMAAQGFLVQISSLFFLLVAFYCLVKGEWGAMFGSLAFGGFLFLLGKLVRIMASRKDR